MRANTSPHIQVKAAGGVRTLDALLDVMVIGVTRIGATATKTILDEFKARKTGEGKRGDSETHDATPAGHGAY
jgi:deoxyribose-phosphate aldolase